MALTPGPSPQRERGGWFDRRGLGPPAALDHRPGRRKTTPVERRRLRVGRLQRRNLQLPRPPRPARSGRAPLPHPKRHRGARPSLRGRRARVPHPSQRHVRPGLLGRPAAAVAPGPRSAGKETAGVSLRVRAADVCQRVEGPAASAGRAAGDRPAGARRVPDLSVRAASADHLPRHRQVAARPLRPLARRPARRATLLAARFQRRGRPAGRRVRPRTAKRC